MKPVFLASSAPTGSVRKYMREKKSSYKQYMNSEYVKKAELVRVLPNGA